MIDFHTHVLPKLDDGSKNIEQSLEMLEILQNQGIDTVFATPHYYPHEGSIEKFLEKREKSYNSLKAAMEGKNYPKIVCGAEVLLTHELMIMEDIDRLCIEGTNLLLLEMPYTPWSLNHINYINQLLATYNVVPVIAHIDRYFSKQTKEMLDALLDMEVMVQCNAAGLVKWGTRLKTLKLIKQGKVHFIGSDCHNTTTRIPRMDKALKILEHHVGKKHIRFFTDNIDIG